jgi:hypothetical protein
LIGNQADIQLVYINPHDFSEHMNIQSSSETQQKVLISIYDLKLTEGLGSWEEADGIWIGYQERVCQKLRMIYALRSLTP